MESIEQTAAIAGLVVSLITLGSLIASLAIIWQKVVSKVDKALELITRHDDSLSAIKRDMVKKDDCLAHREGCPEIMKIEFLQANVERLCSAIEEQRKQHTKLVTELAAFMSKVSQQIENTDKLLNKMEKREIPLRVDN
jgi:hypothetical protein